MRTDLFLQEMAGAIDDAINDFYPEHMGFVLIVFPFGKTNMGTDYISSGQRKDMVSALRESADRIEQGDVIGNPIGTA